MGLGGGKISYYKDGKEINYMQNSKKSLRIGICDDDRIQLENTKRQIESYVQGRYRSYEMVLCRDIQKLAQALQENGKMDLLFLDIELERENAVGSVEKLLGLSSRLRIVYCTNYLHYATEVYDSRHFYYVLKEDLDEKIPRIFDKYERQMRAENSKLVVKTLREGEFSQCIINQKDILYFERNRKNTIIRLMDKDYTVSDKIEQLLERVEPDGYVRCHVSFAVNLSGVEHYRRMSFTMKNGDTVPISRKYIKSTREAFSEWARIQI